MTKMRVLLVSTYELGRQPFGLASPAAWLREAGNEVWCVDAAKEPLREEVVCRADLVAFYLPMHTATRLALPVIERVRLWNPHARLCCYGLYAPPNERQLRSLGVSSVLGAEFEGDLVELVGRAGSADPGASLGSDVRLPHLAFRVPDRDGLPLLSRYASLVASDGEHRVVGYTEASRGCKHFCRHCPVVPVYNGRFRVVPVDVVLADVRAQVSAGAQHVTFGDPDFFNGIRHALRVVEAVADEFPGLSYDVTIKIEHLLRHAAHLRRLRDTGCLFVTTAVESIDDRVLSLLAKEHTSTDFERVVYLCREADLALAPTFVAFTPWTTLEGYCELLRTIQALDLVDHVAPIQLAIRLLIPAGSRLLELAEIQRLVQPFDPVRLVYPWGHPDERVDALQRDVADLVGRRLSASRRQLFATISTLAHDQAGLTVPALFPDQVRDRATVPYLNEPWYC